MIHCEGCGQDYNPEDMQYNTTEVNMRDGTKRHILFCETTCCDLWDDAKPGSWEPLASGEEVQLAHWRCNMCDGVYDYNVMYEVIDTDYADATMAIVCSSCLKKNKERFKQKK